jgi:hypothetical protein
MTKPKSPNSVADTIPVRTTAKGGKLRTGNPGNRGGGRLPDEFKAKMRELVNGPARLAYLQKCLDGEFGPRFHLKAMELLMDRGYGRAAQEVTVKGDPAAPFTIVVRREG